MHYLADSLMNKLIKQKYRRFKAWMNYNPPSALSSKGWRLFNKEFKEVAPIRHYIRENFRKTFIWPIKWKYEAVRDWIRYRTYDQYHKLNTGLKPGYYSIETQMLNVNFNMLKEFVEVEQARHHLWCCSEDDNRTWCEKHMPFYYKFYPFNRPDLGIKHFEWAATLDDPSLPIHERCEYQAIQAREILALYKWWVNQRPARKEIEYIGYDEQGLGSLGCFDDDFDINAPDYIAHRKNMEESSKQEAEWEEEDTEMLVRLVKIRQGLWT